MKLHKKAFTLVELIVVITILAILGTIAFISMSGYSASSRDSVRISDVSSMKTSIELFHLNAGKYPIPDNAEIVTYQGDPLWAQGTFGSIVVGNVSRNLNEIPTDPLSDKEYVYSTSGNRNNFQILNLLEGDLALNTILQTNAANTTRVPRLDGVFNGLYIKTTNYIVPVPSLVTAIEIPTGAGLVLDTDNITSQVVTGGKNIPNVGGVNSATGKLTGLVLSAFTGTIDQNSTTQNKLDLMTAIQTAYTGSSLKNNDIYKVMLGATTEDAILALVDRVVLEKTTSSTVVVGDTDAPTGGDFTIPASTFTTSVTLTITCPIEDGVEMQVSGDITETPIWEACASSKNVTLVTGEGTKNILVNFKDTVGNESGNISKSINLTTFAYGEILNTVALDGKEVIFFNPTGTEISYLDYKNACLSLGAKMWFTSLLWREGSIYINESVYFGSTGESCRITLSQLTTNMQGLINSSGYNIVGDCGDYTNYVSCSSRYPANTQSNNCSSTGGTPSKSVFGGGADSDVYLCIK